MSILKIKDLVHKYVTYGDTEEDKQEIAAIDHIDINVEKGEFVAILGKYPLKSQTECRNRISESR